MNTTATNRKLRQLLTAIRDKSLIPNPSFQRRLVWTNDDKLNFLSTVLNDYPFPEIYIAAGDVNPQTGEATEMLVDGQQRITTLYQYFTGSQELKIKSGIKAYKDLSEEQQINFLQYEVVCRDLGKMDIEEIKKIFQKINSTSYSLNAMEFHNARFAGKFKTFSENISKNPFFENHNIFTYNEVRRMRDVSFVVAFVITIMSTYFHLEDEFESYLNNYNDEFEIENKLRREIETVFEFIDICDFDKNLRVWKNSDLFTLLVEIHRAIIKEKRKLNTQVLATKLKDFYHKVDLFAKKGNDKFPDKELNTIINYYKATQQATNNRANRITRGLIIRDILIS